MSDPQEPTQTDEQASPPAADGNPSGDPASQLQRERDELYDRLLRKTAEFDNFRKRIERERKDFTEWAAAEVLNDLLAVMDDFDRALAADAPASAQVYKTGVELIHRALADLVRKRGVAPIEAVGEDIRSAPPPGGRLRHGRRRPRGRGGRGTPQGLHAG